MTQSNKPPELGAFDAFLALEATTAELGRVERCLMWCVEKLGGQVVIPDEDQLKPRRMAIVDEPGQTVVTTK